MSATLLRLRWRLARLCAPEPIIVDLTRGEDGAFVIVRQQGTLAMWRLAEFRMRSWLQIPTDEAYRYGKSGRLGSRLRRYFVGRVA